MRDFGLSEHLLQLLAEDQEDLKQYKAGTLSLEDINNAIHARTEEARRIFEIEFPKIRLVGEDAYRAFIALVLHSDDPGFMDQVANAILASETEDVDTSHAAFITDKLLVREGRPQRYGTQYSAINEDGSISFFPFEDPREIDTRRAEMGLSSIHEYEEMIRENGDRNRT
ncbi:hypothetical protein KGM48_01840 [Patescibacteria group bacterium]|nr:hypothetical protein [Patescibacteria group bacterium]